MAAKIIDGKAIASAVEAEVIAGIKALGRAPRLDVVLVGDDPASKVYVNMKEVASGRVGIKSVKHSLPEGTSEAELLELVSELNADGDVDGILVQLPLPKHINEPRVISAISPAKDVDGLHPTNAGLLFAGTPRFIPCTPAGVMRLLDSLGTNYVGKRAVVVGRSSLVGKPVAMLLLQRHCTVTLCHSRTLNLPAETRQADILIAAVGQPRLITAEMVKRGAVVIDVGTTKVDGKLCGDVDFASVKEIASAISPVPGGVGPMTVALLMKNTLEAAKNGGSPEV